MFMLHWSLYIGMVLHVYLDCQGNSRILPDEMYNLELAKMRNHVHDPEQMLSLIAPCSKFSNSVKNRWRAFFRPRTGRIKTELNTVFPSRQNLLNGEIEAVFNLPASFNASAFAQHEIVAVDLSILRVPPCKIDEILGIYTLNVDQILGNRTRNIHRSKQATCPTLGGHMMVAELRLNPIKNWFYQSDIPLMLRVQLHTERLVVGSQSEALQDTSNLRKVLSLTIHHKLGNAQQQVQPTSIKRHSRYLGRSKRSLSNIRSKLTTSDCRIVNYPYKLQTYGEEFEILYPKVWNIKECVGRCSYPLFNMNSTNHGIAMSEQLAFHPNPPFQPTVDCVPIAFGDIYHVTYGPDRILQSGFISKLEANYCGCA